MSQRFDQLVQIMETLRGEGGCPWDRKQTRESLKPYLIEEAYEVLETIEAQDDPKLKEELGDVLLQVLFHAQIGRERNTFTIEDVLQTLAEKLIRRHPHVFGEVTVNGAEEVVHRWEEIKRQEKADQSDDGESGSALDGVPKALPALLRAYQLQVRAARVGFDWPHDESGYAQVVGKIHEELREVDEARAAAAKSPTGETKRHLEEETGDLLFAVVNLARLVKVNPEEALRGAANRFAARFTHMEQAAKAGGRLLTDMTLGEMDRLWDDAKAAEEDKPQP
ncbi:MAG TPA: nucleoside triphosphate pyrophosphohydrolase [Nitrospirales bacterium]